MNTTRIALALGLGLTAALANVLGGLFVVRRNWSREFLKYFLALGAGFMLGVVFLDIVPESTRLVGIDGAMLCLLIGYFLIHLFEHTLAPHFHFGEETHTHELAPHHTGISALLGLVIHAFFDGVAIASGFLVSMWLGWVIFAAIILHKLPEGFAISSLMLATGTSRRKALWAAAILGAATLCGVLLMGALRTDVQYALPLAGGVTLYVAASDLIPEVNREPSARIATLVFLGLALVFLVHHLFHI
ncbi:MAG TPA: ZIP family metal transporter [Candidatus Limnocylindrales bacterium]|nr:ZIP family metal transporter [Candidatus Limnocylindrales bacterium]